MSRVLKHNVVLRKDLNSVPVTFLKGQSLPDWAEGLVGDHLFEDMSPYDGVSKPVALHARTPKKTGLPSSPASEKKTETPKETNEVPKRNASRQTWKKFAEKNGIDVPTEASREDIVSLVEAKFPDLAD